MIRSSRYYYQEAPIRFCGDAWMRSACYPRGSLYPLSSEPTTRRRRITKTCFRTCSTCRSRSQAPLCLCTLRLVSNQPEGTFARLRYSFGGDRPSQTAQLTLSSARIHGTELELKQVQGGISRLAPPRLASRLHSLPPILHRACHSPVSACSKGSRGLSV